MTHKIAEIKGLDPTILAKLEEAKIMTTEQLLHETATPQQRTALAKRLGVDNAHMNDWINRADLMRLKGVGTEMSNLLEECGVDSCKELRHRKPATLAEKLKATNDEKHITHHAPTEAQVTEWVHEAEQFSTQHT